jgi:hypothetical protein
MTLTDEQLTDLVVGQHNERLKFVAREAVYELKETRSRLSHAKRLLTEQSKSDDPIRRSMAEFALAVLEQVDHG